MWKYIITWCLVTVVSDPCPDLMKKDEFGRQSNISCAALHYHYETARDKADNFFETGVNWPVNEDRKKVIQRSIGENRPFLRYPDGI